MRPKYIDIPPVNVKYFSLILVQVRNEQAILPMSYKRYYDDINKDLNNFLQQQLKQLIRFFPGNYQ